MAEPSGNNSAGADLRPSPRKPEPQGDGIFRRTQEDMKESQVRLQRNLKQSATVEFSEQLKAFREHDAVTRKSLGFAPASERMRQATQPKPAAPAPAPAPGAGSSQPAAASGPDKPGTTSTSGGQAPAEQASQPTSQLPEFPNTLPQSERPFLRPDKRPGLQMPPAKQPDASQKQKPIDPERLQRAQKRALGAVMNANPLVRRVAESQGAQKAAGKAVGAATSQIWIWAASAAYLSGFTVVGFYLGTLVMDIYWIVLHRRNKELFPLKLWQKAVTVFSNLIAILAPVVIIVLLFIVACQLPGASLAPGLGAVCKALKGSATFGGFGGTQSGGIQLPSGPLSTDSWSGAIQSMLSSGRYPNVDACMMRVIIQKESGGNSAAIGYDYPPDKRNSPFQPNNPPLYGLNWTHSHGIGLTQWTIFPQNSSNRWQDSNTPSRYLNDPYLGARYYTLADFLDPQISLQLTAATLNRNIAANLRNGMDRMTAIQKAFGDYNGSGVSGSYANSTIQLYRMCLQQFGG